MRMSHIVIKKDDLTKYLNSKEYNALSEVLCKINQGRSLDKRPTDHRYIIVNMDEPYVDEVISVLEKHGHWGDGTSQFTHIETQAALHEAYVEMLETEIAKLRGALEFYADKKNYNRILLSILSPSILIDDGYIARKTLGLEASK